MAFHAGYCETVLFDFWKVSGVGGFLGSMIAIFIMAVLYEFLKNYRRCVSSKSYSLRQCVPAAMSAQNSTGAQDSRMVYIMGEMICEEPQTMFNRVHGFQTFLHILQFVLGYFLMLIFMTYNVWLCVALVVGTGVGYFLFGWNTACVVDVCENCH
jgi:copper transporter 1